MCIRDSPLRRALQRPGRGAAGHRQAGRRQPAGDFQGAEGDDPADPADAAGGREGRHRLRLHHLHREIHRRGLQDRRRGDRAGGDVYKRQGRSSRPMPGSPRRPMSWWSKASAAGPPRSTTAWPRPISVSYTHLDVYKRQEPYKNFIYTSFQELATYVSHNRVSQIAKEYGDKKLSTACKLIAGDEMRHHTAYSEFVNQIFKIDPSEMMLAFQYMMKQKITMPAHFLRESGQTLSLIHI